MTIFRDPDEETEGYPGLWVHDGRVTGSITVGQSRLPIWAFNGVAVIHGWDEVELGWEPSKYDWTADHHADFLYNLLEARGEFGRLLLVIANAERLYSEAEDAVMAASPHTSVEAGVAITKIALTDDDEGARLPPPWWADPDLKQPVVEQLRRCLAALEDGET